MEDTPAYGQDNEKPELPDFVKELTGKQKRFVEEYVKDFNGKQSAIRAGYSQDSATEIAYENLTKLHIKAYLNYLLDNRSMVASEVLDRLTAWGRGSLEPFVKRGHDELLLDLTSDKAIENISLIKKIKQTRRILKTDTKEDGESLETNVQLLEVTTEIELYDAKDAVIKIGQIRNMFKQQIDLNGTIILDDGLDD